MQYGTCETRINGGSLLTEYREGIRFGTDALLLAGFARERIGSGRCADFGTGSGVLPILLLSCGSRAHFLAVEIQEKYARLAEQNFQTNGYAERAEVLCGDLREHRSLFPAGSMDSVISNPPYLPADCGRKNLTPEKRIAWHEEFLRVDELAAAAAWALRPGGRFFCVYLPSRAVSLFASLRACALEPKRMRLVAPSATEKPSLLLLEAKKDASEGMELLPTLSLYTDVTHREETEELRGITASFA